MTAEPDNQVVDLIILTNLCQTFHCLPSPGGLFDQEPYLMEGMKMILAAQSERAEIDRNK